MVTKPHPPEDNLECVWCYKQIPDEEADMPCPSNSGDPHVRWLFDAGTGLKEMNK